MAGFFFTLKQTPFQKGFGVQESKPEVIKSVSLVKWQKIYLENSAPSLEIPIHLSDLWAKGAKCGAIQYSNIKDSKSNSTSVQKSDDSSHIKFEPVDFWFSCYFDIDCSWYEIV